MGRVIVVQFITVDGVVEDPDGSAGTPAGGWAFQHGPELMAGDKFQLGAVLDEGVLLLGRVTWELFAARWPGRSGGFADAMNGASKAVASRTLTDVSAWSSSTRLRGDLLDEVGKLRSERDVVVAGSMSIVQALVGNDLVDEYRLLVFPTLLGTGQRLSAPTSPAALRLVSVEQAGPTALLRYERRPDLPGRP